MTQRLNTGAGHWGTQGLSTISPTPFRADHFMTQITLFHVAAFLFPTAFHSHHHHEPSRNRGFQGQALGTKPSLHNVVLFWS